MGSPEPERAALFSAQPLGTQGTCRQPLGQLRDPILYPSIPQPTLGWGQATTPWHVVSFHLPFSSKGTRTKPLQGPPPLSLGTESPRAYKDAHADPRAAMGEGCSSTHGVTPQPAPGGGSGPILSALDTGGLSGVCPRASMSPRPLWGP